MGLKKYVKVSGLEDNVRSFKPYKPVALDTSLTLIYVN